MKKKLQIVILFLLFWVGKAQSVERTWTSQSGRAIQAEFVSSDASTVTLNVGGKLHKVSLLQLSQSDLLWVQQQQASSIIISHPSASVAPVIPVPRMDKKEIIRYLIDNRLESKLEVVVEIGGKNTILDDARSVDSPAIGVKNNTEIKEIREYLPNPNLFPWSVLLQTPKLERLTLVLSSTPRPVEMAALGKLNNLQKISLNGDAVLDKNVLSLLPRMPKVHSLDLSPAIFKQSDLLILAEKFPSVKRLSIVERFENQSFTVTEVDFLVIPKIWPGLIELKVQGCSSFNDTMATAVNESKLTTLILTDFKTIDWQALSSCQKIERLDLAVSKSDILQATGVESALPLLVTLPKLSRIKIAGARLAANHFNGLQSGSISEIHIDSDAGFDGAALDALASNFSAISRLKLSQVPLNDNDLTLIRKITGINSVYIENIPGITQQGYSSITKMMPRCYVTYIASDNARRLNMIRFEF